MTGTRWMLACLLALSPTLGGCHTMDGVANDLLLLADMAGQGVDTVTDGAETTGQGIRTLQRLFDEEPQAPANPYR